MQVACLVVEHFPYQVQAQRERGLKGRPAVVGSQAQGVVDCSPEAAALGITADMPLRQAQARAADLAILEPDTGCYAAEWGHVLDALQERSPVVEDDGWGRAYIGVDGLERLYRDSANLASAFRSAVPPFLEARLGLGPGKFPAHVAALHAGTNRAFKAPEDISSFLAPKPVELLPVSWEVRERLRGFGLITLRHVARQDVGPLQAQFGPKGRLVWELARGIDTRPLLARQTETIIEESISFPIPTADMGPVLLALRRLLGHAYGRQGLRGHAARVADLRAVVLNGRPWCHMFPFRRAMSSPDAAFFALKASLDNVALPGPLEELSLTLTGIASEAGDQLNLFVDRRKRDNLIEAMRQVREITGGRVPLWQAQEMEPWSRHPERRYVLVEFAS